MTLPASPLARSNGNDRRMKVLIVGKGGREHAIAWKLSSSPHVSELLCAPGNAGTSSIAENVPISDADVEALLTFSMQHAVDFTVVGPEAPLAEGIVDRFRESGLSIFGPTQAAARIESSKSYAKNLMLRAGIPTARAEVFDDFDSARRYVESVQPPVVIKADGLTAGKGVAVATATEDAIAALQRQMIDGEFGSSGETVLVEECLEGQELSVFAFVDGERLSPLIAAVDYKRAHDGGAGPNTGGMGSYSPPTPQLWTDETERRARVDIMEPIVAALAEDGNPYVGILYAGLMATDDGLKVIEFNCRLGDPEAQVILPRIETDLVDILQAAVNGNVGEAPVRAGSDPCVAVVLASKGYPGRYDTGVPVLGIDDVGDDTIVFHAGTKVDENGATVTDGGRILTISASGRRYQEARRRAYSAAAKIDIDGAFYRTDIADFP